jgi:hypothetical protein
LRDLSRKCKSAWKVWKKAGRPSQGPVHEEKKRLSRLTKKCANKCRTNQERNSWKKREKMFKTNDSRHFKTPFNQPSLRDKLLYGGSVTSDPAKIQCCWSNHFKSLFRSQIGSSSSLADTNKAFPHLEFLSKMNFMTSLTTTSLSKRLR